MKSSYFTQASADTDDLILIKAIDDGHVPPGCLLGGIVIRELRDGGDDPCTLCDCDRARCGGRPKAAKSGDTLISRLRNSMGGAPMSRKLTRGRMIDQLIAACREMKNE